MPLIVPVIAWRREAHHGLLTAKGWLDPDTLAPHHHQLLGILGYLGTVIDPMNIVVHADVFEQTFHQLKSPRVGVILNVLEPTRISISPSFNLK